jgi:hypothetical protein
VKFLEKRREQLPDVGDQGIHDTSLADPPSVLLHIGLTSRVTTHPTYNPRLCDSSTHTALVSQPPLHCHSGEPQPGAKPLKLPPTGTCVLLKAPEYGERSCMLSAQHGSLSLLGTGTVLLCSGVDTVISEGCYLTRAARGAPRFN